MLLTFAPKCVLCLVAYAAAGTALRFGGAEICGAAAGRAGQWIAWLPGLGLAAGVAGYFACGRRRRENPPLVTAP